MKLFEKILMASEDVKSYLVSGVCETELHDGALVKIGDLVDHEVYAGLKDMNTRHIEAYAGQGRYGFVDYVGVSEADAMGVKYRVGDKTAGMPVPAGKHTRVRVPQIGDEFFLGDGNFDTEVGANGYAIAGSNGLLTPAAAATKDGLCIKIEFETNKIVGAVNDGKKYFCTVLSI